MNRRILIQVTAPAVVIGLLMLSTCVLGVWYIHRSQRNLRRIYSQNISSLRATQELEISVRQLRHRNFLYMIDPVQQKISAGAPPTKEMKQHQQTLLGAIDAAHTSFEAALAEVQEAAHSPQEDELIEKIKTGYAQYQAELVKLRTHPPAEAPRDLSRWAESHPIQYVVKPCEALVQLDQERLASSYQRSVELGTQAEGLMLLLGIAGPAGGVVLGFGIAWGLSRSIYQLSVRVQDMTHRLDQDVASVSIAADGDIRTLDRQLAVVVERVEEVADRLQRHQREMLRAEQLSAVGQLAASVAHEVRNPLTSVKMLVEAALRGRNRKPLTQDDLQVIHGEIG
ncbi:MAG TPA: histidine kinase dimerization/phospho-acceptor domain-containing protein, partial [Gemmataceae bacterium]|nr:histidine kinase dimerization/phospho-acceptor domain-containing protein [Gemmataceae bacterium]